MPIGVITCSEVVLLVVVVLVVVGVSMLLVIVDVRLGVVLTDDVLELLRDHRLVDVGIAAGVVRVLPAAFRYRADVTVPDTQQQSLL